MKIKLLIIIGIILISGFIISPYLFNITFCSPQAWHCPASMIEKPIPIQIICNTDIPLWVCLLDQATGIDQRDKENIPHQLLKIFASCACKETDNYCTLPFIDWENFTHYIDNNGCMWEEITEVSSRTATLDHRIYSHPFGYTEPIPPTMKEMQSNLDKTPREKTPLTTEEKNRNYPKGVLP